MTNKTHPQSREKIIQWTLVFILLVQFFAVFHIGLYKVAVSSGDSAGYYVYLPAYFIEHDFQYIREIMGQGEDYSGKQEGAFVNKYTSGVALLQLPFFSVGHLSAKAFGYEQDGYSPPYILALVASILFYVFWGFYFLSKVLIKHFSPKVVATVLIILSLATNLFYFTVMNNQMSHGYLFFLYALLIYATDRWYQHPNFKMAFLIGISAGFITLIRPSDILALAIPVFYGISNWADVKKRFAFFGKHWPKLLLAILAFASMATPQLAYWKTVTGNWLYYSYRNEGFDFRHPHVWDALTDGKNGWLRYTPIMIFSLIGIGFLFKKRTWLWPVLLFLPLYMFIVYSWHNWFYINSFGSRPMVGPYALLAIPLAYFVQYAFAKKWRKNLFIALVVLLGGLNIFQTYQESWGVSRTEFASNAYYWKIFGKTKMDYSMLSTFETNINQPRHTKIKKTLYENSFVDTAVTHLNLATYHSSPASLLLNKDFGEIILISKTASELNVQAHDYLKISGWFYADSHVSWWGSATILGYIDRDGKISRWRQMWINNKIAAERSNYSLWNSNPKVWSEVYFYYKVPSSIRPNDKIYIKILNPHPSNIYVDDLTIEVCEKI